MSPTDQSYKNQSYKDLFESIESAHQYVNLLGEVVADAKTNLDAGLDEETLSQFPRQRDALRLASYNLQKLGIHMGASSRILNDLRSIRRLLFHEREDTRRKRIESSSLQVGATEKHSAYPKV